MNENVSRRPSPAVESLKWGRVHTAVGVFCDAKLWPGGGRGWDWDETGTRHSPGVQAADVLELLDHGSVAVVIGCGQHRRLGVTDDAIRAVADRRAEAFVLESAEAVRRYNALVDHGVAVGALIHSTC